MTQFKRKKGENFEAFLRRFNKGLKQSGRLYTAKSKKYLARKKTKREQKQYALTSLKIRAKKEYLRKIGKLPEEAEGFRKKR